MGRLSLPLGILAGLCIHLVLIGALDLRDLPGPGGTLLVTDLARGAFSEGLSAWLGWPLAVLLGPLLGVRVLMASAAAAAMLGAALGSRALGGSALLGALLAACWSLSAGQPWLISGSTVAWGLAWLGLGVTWDAARRDAPSGAGLGTGLLVLAAAAKPTALAALPLVVPALLLTQRRAVLLGAMAAGGLLALIPAWLTLPTDTPWLAAQALGVGESSGGLWGLVAQQGRLPLAVGLALLCAGLARSRPATACMVLVLVGAGVVAVSRGERLQPRHLLPLCFGLVVSCSLLSRSRAASAVLVALLLADTVAWSHAFADQRAEHLDVARSALPGLPWPRYPEPAWAVFYESSTPGALALMTHATAARGGALILPLVDRRESHASAAAALAGQPVIVLTQARCCRQDETTRTCADRLVSALRASPASAILPSQSRAVPEGHRPLAEALLTALSPRHRRAAERWRVVAGAGDGPLPCADR